MGFLVICTSFSSIRIPNSFGQGAGITILQMSKVDPTHLSKLDRRSTILLQAARNNTENTEKSLSGSEDPGMDALRGSFGTVGSIIRARSARRLSQSSRDTTRSGRRRHGFPGGTPDLRGAPELPRHQLYDAPVPNRNESSSGSDVGDISREYLRSGTPRTPTIKFGDQDVAHYYHGPGEPAGARHEMLTPHLSPRLTPAGSQIQRQPSPLGDLERGPATAPPGKRTFYQPTGSDPFATSPATASSSGAGFPIAMYDDEPPRGTHPHRYQSSSGRSYPKTGGADDRDESMSLVREPVSEKEQEGESESDADFDGPPQGGIRLLSSSTRL